MGGEAWEAGTRGPGRVGARGRAPLLWPLSGGSHGSVGSWLLPSPTRPHTPPAFGGCRLFRFLMVVEVAGVFTGKRDRDGPGLAALGGVRARLAALGGVRAGGGLWGCGERGARRKRRDACDGMRGDDGSLSRVVTASGDAVGRLFNVMLIN